MELNLERSSVQLEPQKSGEQRIREVLRATILLGLAGYFFYNIVTGNLANYINERFVWLSYTAVGIFLALGSASVAQMFSKAQEDTRYQLTGSRVVTWATLIIGAIPLVFGVMVPSAPLGAEAVNGNISTRAVRGVNASAFAVAPENRNILDWLRMFNDSSDFAEFNGQPVNLSGFVYREPDYGDNEMMVARFTVSCCVADASALGLPIHYEGAAQLNQGDWIQVTGEMQVADFGDDTTPVVMIEQIVPIEQPEHPYLYP
jgi:putative membrane protein